MDLLEGDSPASAHERQTTLSPEFRRRAVGVLYRLRTMLFALSALLCTGTLVELWLVEHTESAVQWIPFVLCGLGLAVSLWALLQPRRHVLWILRAVMVVVALGSAFGVYEHIEHNLLFELEIRPNATPGDVWLETLRGGNPLLAPAVLGLAALLSLIATYQHRAFFPQDAGRR